MAIACDDAATLTRASRLLQSTQEPCRSPSPGGRGDQQDGRGRQGEAFKSGFTLLEISIVLFIMGLMLLIAMPYFGGFKSAQLKSATRRLAGRATYLFEEASSRKLVIRLVFDLDRNMYYVLVADPYAPAPVFLPDHSWAGAPVRLPPAVRIRDVTVEGVGTYTRGAVACQFFPEGYVDATIVHLIDAAGEAMTLAINPLTGRARIASGDMNQDELTD